MGNQQNMNDQLRVRREKMQELRAEGIDPFGHRFERDSMNQDLHDKYGEMDKDELNGLEITATIAGRMVAKRGKGKVGFADLQDRTGRMQLYIRKDEVGEDMYHIFKRSDLGDFLGIKGHVIKTDMGELTIKVTELTFLSKALRPLPDKWHGLQDVEQIYRQRYLDLISNKESYDRFVNRSRIISAIRRYLDGEGFLKWKHQCYIHKLVRPPTSIYHSPQCFRYRIISSDRTRIALEAFDRWWDGTCV